MEWWEIDKARENSFKELFGEEWYGVLKNYVNREEFIKISRLISAERKIKSIYPPSKDVFSLFHRVSFKDIKVVLLGLDPYPHKGQAIGISFAVNEGTKKPSSLRNIIKEILIEYPGDEDIINNLFNEQYYSSLKYLTDQGVFLLNTALTVEEGNAGSHLKLWKNFTDYLIEAISSRMGVVWILLGVEAQKFNDKISLCPVVMAPHPASESYKKDAGFFGSDVFKKCNKFLLSMNESEINWKPKIY